MTVSDYLASVEQRFAQANLCYGHGTDNALDEAVYLVYASLGIDFSVAVRDCQQEMTAAQHADLEAKVQRRIETREPVAYIVGESWFCGLPFFSDQRALIPRSPFAELIANKFQPMLNSEPQHILDLCSGSGCIGIACALTFPNARVDLVDISVQALALATTNINRHGTSDKVRALHSDLYSAISQRYDLIVANPPYVSASEVNTLPPEFGHEPRLGLESDEDGLAIPLAILRQSEEYLFDDGLLLMEVGYNAENLQSRLPDLPILWMEFDQGGEGVMAITAAQLRQFREALN